MLYNPQWNQSKPKPGTMASLIAWLETKDPNETYNYLDDKRCLAGQYNREMGRKYNVTHAMGGFGGGFGFFMNFDRKMERIARNSQAFHDLKNRTFGEALHRAKTWKWYQYAF